MNSGYFQEKTEISRYFPDKKLTRFPGFPQTGKSGNSSTIRHTLVSFLHNVLLPLFEGNYYLRWFEGAGRGAELPASVRTAVGHQAQTTGTGAQRRARATYAGPMAQVALGCVRVAGAVKAVPAVPAPLWPQMRRSQSKPKRRQFCAVDRRPARCASLFGQAAKLPGGRLVVPLCNACTYEPKNDHEPSQIAQQTHMYY